MTWRRVVAGLAWLALAAICRAQNFEDLADRVRECALENGMKFLVIERDIAPVVSFHVYADVGSANEHYGITGISHLLEHMAFKGSKTVGTKDYEAEAKLLARMDEIHDEIARESRRQRPDAEKVAKLRAEFEECEAKAKEFVVNNEYFDLTLQEGDAGVNAYTSWDSTHYINSLPSNKLEFWMALTSDRFLNPVFREFYKEREVVREERRLRTETRPIGRLVEDFLATAFKAHPYGHPVVGHMSDIVAIRRGDVEDYFRKYYCPSNLTVAVVGDVKAEEVFAMANLYFGRIPSGPRPEPVRTEEPEQWGERRVQVVAKAQPFVIVGYHRPAASHEDDAALEALADIIGQGRSSRLHRALVTEAKVAVQVGCFNGFPGRKYANLVAFYAVPSRDRTAAECLAKLDAEIEKIKDEPVSERELRKFQRNTTMSLIENMRANDDMAALLASADVLLGDWRNLFEELEKVRRVRAEDVRRVARTYLHPKNRTVAEIVPEKGR